jgi:hypothetical protein
LSIALFVVLLACLEIGFRVGDRSAESQRKLTHEGVVSIEAAVFALLGLLLGFSFAGATSRLEDKRQLIVQESNTIARPIFGWTCSLPMTSPACAGCFANISTRDFIRQVLERRAAAFAPASRLAFK